MIIQPSSIPYIRQERKGRMRAGYFRACGQRQCPSEFWMCAGLNRLVQKALQAEETNGADDWTRLSLRTTVKDWHVTPPSCFTGLHTWLWSLSATLALPLGSWSESQGVRQWLGLGYPSRNHAVIPQSSQAKKRLESSRFLKMMS